MRGVRRSKLSVELATRLFPRCTREGRGGRAAAVVATAVLIATDAARFKRGKEGAGWRALPPSVAVSRARGGFVEACRVLLERKVGVRERAGVWTREHLEMLRELEICAASGCRAEGSSAVALGELGYEGSDEGAAALLLDIGYWATGTVERDGGGTTQDRAPPTVRTKAVEPVIPKFKDGKASQRKALMGDVEKFMKVAPDADALTGGEGDKVTKEVAKSVIAPSDVQGSENGKESDPKGGSGDHNPFPASMVERHAVRDWTFPPPILAEARDLRTRALSRRQRYVTGKSMVPKPRRSLVHGDEGRSAPRVYCIDDKNARFLDDALSIEIIEPGRLVRLSVHIADVDETVRSGSAIDELAKERGQSLYLPLKPLHMLPAAAMDAASFSTAGPTEGLTVIMDVDVVSSKLVFWEIFASLVPPVVRLNYDEVDIALEGPKRDCKLDQQTKMDLKGLAVIAPILADKLDTRRSSRKTRASGASNVNGGSKSGHSKSSAALNEREAGIASVRLVRRRELGPNAGGMKVAQVTDFRNTGGHSMISDILISVSTLFRQFAHRHGAFLPEDRGAHQYVSRCGTAPMRRYADLAIQRQVKCILFGREPAGRRRMDELRVWLAKRHAAGEKTVATRRKTALYDSLADHCAQQRSAAQQPYATLRGHIRNVIVTRKREVRAEVGIDGTGLSTMADVDSGVWAEKSAVLADAPKAGRVNGAEEREKQLERVSSALKTGDEVCLHVSQVDTAAQRIVARVVSR